MQYIWDYYPLSIDIIPYTYGYYFSPQRVLYSDVRWCRVFFMKLKEDDMGVLPCNMRCHVLVYAVYGCVICERNVSNVIQWFLSVSYTNPHDIFDMPISKPIANLGPDKCLGISAVYLGQIQNSVCHTWIKDNDTITPNLVLPVVKSSIISKTWLHRRGSCTCSNQEARPYQVIKVYFSYNEMCLFHYQAQKWNPPCNHHL